METKYSDLTDSQVASINALCITSGWSDVAHLKKHGANPASLLNLVNRGVASSRESICVKGYPFLEFCLNDSYRVEVGIPNERV